MSSFDPRAPGEGDFGRVLGRSSIPDGTESSIVDGALRRVRSRRRRGLVLKGGAVLAAAAAVAIAVLSLAGVFRVGPVQMPKTAKSPVQQPTAPVVWTAADRTAQHTIGRHRVTLSSGTQVKVIGDAPEAARLELLSGEAQFAVQPLQQEASFTVLTPQVKVVVVGTRFSVASDELCTRVGVAEGQVRATTVASGKAYLLGPGMSRTFCSESDLAGAHDADERQVGQALALVAADRELDRASELLERYLERQPNGALAEEALYYLVIIEDRRGNPERAATLANRFLSRFPDTPRAARLRRWLSKKPDRR
jgi:ferric-dicitrate binding protein FerR (iron transport regulator)